MPSNIHRWDSYTAILSPLVLLLFSVLFLSGCSKNSGHNKPDISEGISSKGEGIVCLIDMGPLNPDIFNRMLSAGRMPHIKELIKKGEKFSIQPPQNGIFDDATVSSEILTGIPAGDNGITAAYWCDNTRNRFLVSGRTEMRFPPLWDELADNGVSSLFINIPLTHTPDSCGAIIISDRLLLCPNNSIYPPQLKDILMDAGIIPSGEGIDDKIGNLFSTKNEMERADIEVLNRFLNFPLSEQNLADLVGECVDPGAIRLERCLRLLAWELRKDRAILSVLDFLAANYQLPDFIAIRSGALEVAQRCFMRYYAAKGFNITPSEMERFGSVIERCYEYEDGFVGRVLKSISDKRRVILVSGYSLRPATEWADSLSNGNHPKLAMAYRDHPVGIRIQPDKLAEAFNTKLQISMDVNLRSQHTHPLYPLPVNNKPLLFSLIPNSLKMERVSGILEYLKSFADSLGDTLFTEVSLVDTANQIIKVKLGSNIKPGDIYFYGDESIDASDFLFIVPQISAFASNQSALIVSPKFDIRYKKPKKLTDVHDLILRGFGIQPKGLMDSLSKIDMVPPKRKPCDDKMAFRLKTLGYIE